jgi:glyoxylase-like metal-dependent hydrolase (beta-lactamase superfamily II)
MFKNASSQHVSRYALSALYTLALDAPTFAIISRISNLRFRIVFTSFGSSLAGRLTENLKAAGFNPEDVDKVVLTHGHPDHIWGLIDEFEEAQRFPNATYYIAEAE